jgi:hypothetical protein
MSATEILKSAFTLALYITATTTTLATAQEATFSEGERLGLAACLSKCPDNDNAAIGVSRILKPRAVCGATMCALALGVAG